MPTKAKENVVRLFGDDEAPEAAIDISHLTRPQAASEAPGSQGVDLSGKPKALLAIGMGSTGKTTLLRWVCERSLMQGAGDDLTLASVDPISRELAAYFPSTMAPKTADPAAIVRWLEQLIAALMENRRSAAIDFGGGDTSLTRLVGEMPDLVTMMEDAGVAPVAIYMLSPRSSDLTPLAALEAVGFQPRATALVLNEGRADTSREREQEFAHIRRHSAYRAALARGAVEVWMPRLFAAKAIEDRRMAFRAAVDGGVGMFDRSRTRAWLASMETAFAPISSWLP